MEVEEVSVIDSINTTKSGLEGRGAKVVGIVLGDTAARQIAKELGLQFPVNVHAERCVTSFYGLPVLPDDHGPRCALMVDVFAGVGR